MQMITKEWLESILTSYYIFIEHFQGDPDVEVLVNKNHILLLMSIYFMKTSKVFLNFNKENFET